MTINQRQNKSPQVLYQGRWVDRNNFRVFVYCKGGEKLVNSYDQYNELIQSGLWFSSKELETKQPIKKVGRKAKNGNTNS